MTVLHVFGQHQSLSDAVARAKYKYRSRRRSYNPRHRPHLLEATLDRLFARATAQPDNQEDATSQAPPMNDDARADDTERDDVLNAVSAKWKRLSRQEISALKTSRELIVLVVAKYGIKPNAARRDVEALLDGRNLTA
jgi:hypothetical protein